MNSGDHMRLDVLALHNGLTTPTLAARTPTPHRQALRVRCWLRWGLRCPCHRHRLHHHLDAAITPSGGWWAVFIASGMSTELLTMGGRSFPREPPIGVPHQKRCCALRRPAPSAHEAQSYRRPP